MQSGRSLWKCSHFVSYAAVIEVDFQLQLLGVAQIAFFFTLVTDFLYTVGYYTSIEWQVKNILTLPTNRNKKAHLISIYHLEMASNWPQNIDLGGKNHIFP